MAGLFPDSPALLSDGTGLPVVEGRPLPGLDDVWDWQACFAPSAPPPVYGIWEDRALAAFESALAPVVAVRAVVVRPRDVLVLAPISNGARAAAHAALQGDYARRASLAAFAEGDLGGANRSLFMKEFFEKGEPCPLHNTF